jgi:thymidylate kinase
VLIEVCGPDGVGKSTVVDAARRVLRETTGVVAYERVLRSESRNLVEYLETAAGRSMFAPRDKELAVLFDIVRQAHADLRLYRTNPIAHAFVTFYRCALLARLHRKGLAEDAGLVALLGQLPAPDVSVRLVLPPEHALRRLADRPKGDQLLTHSDPRSELGRSVAAFAAAGRDPGYPQVVLNADREPAELVAAVTVLIERRVDGGGAEV